MSDVTRIVGVALVTTALLGFLRKEMPPIGVQVAMAFVVVALLFLLQPLHQVVQAFLRLADGANVRSVYLALVLKAVGIAYVASIGAGLCKDAGEEAIGSVVELAGKVFILALAVPVVAAILEALARLLPG